MDNYAKHRPDGSVIASRAFTAFIRQKKAQMIVTSPVNSAIATTLNCLNDIDQNILLRFYESDHQIPARFERETGIKVSDLIPLLRRSQAEVFRRLGFPSQE